ncbi:Rhodanese-like protein [Atractiella rhizophila]|nr:Rhodanese-like protein [Atractiella rhizophila]
MGLKHMLPSAERFGEECERLGIGRDTKVVVYDSVGTWSAPRTLWTFKAFGHADACILDGGLPRWLAEGFEVDDSSETGRRTLTPKSTSYSTPELLKSFVRDYPFMVENSKFDLVEDGEGGGQLVLDARAKGRFDGTAPEPRPNLSSGHIPNSINLPFTDLLTPPSDTNPPYQTLLPQDELRKVFERTMERYNIPPSSLTTRNFVTTCGSGMTAAIIWLALQVAGLKPDQVGLYDESWTGYAARKESKIVKS